MIPEDKRGKHSHHNQVRQEIVHSVRDHINSLPRIEYNVRGTLLLLCVGYCHTQLCSIAFTHNYVIDIFKF